MMNQIGWNRVIYVPLFYKGAFFILEENRKGDKNDYNYVKRRIHKDL